MMMRYNFLAILACLLIGFTIKAHAQEIGEVKPLTIGVRGGVNVAQQNYNPSLTGATTSEKTGATAGIDLTYAFSDAFGLSIELLYVQKGGEVSFSNFSGSDTATNGNFHFNVQNSKSEYTFNYLEIPITAHEFLMSGNFRPYLFAGPTIGIKLSATNDFSSLNAANTGTPSVSFATGSIDMSDDLEPFDLGITGGAGLLYAFNPYDALILDASYNYGLIDIHKGKGTGAQSTHIKVATRDVRLLLGVQFGFPER